jgi:hypothetical protein
MSYQTGIKLTEKKRVGMYSVGFVDLDDILRLWITSASAKDILQGRLGPGLELGQPR